METVEYDLALMSAIIFVPSLFALGLLFFPKGKDEAMRWFALGGTLVTLVLTIFLFIDYYQSVHTFNGKENGALALLSARADQAILDKAVKYEAPKDRDLIGRIPWIKRFNIDYYLGVDGISMALVLLTSVLSFLSMLAAWNIEKSVKGFCMLFLILETGMLGTFLALDFFLFYVFWEVMLLPMYFLIGIWGGPRREYAAIKFFLYTLFGSVLMLVAMLGLYFTDLSPLKGKIGPAFDAVVDTVKGENSKAPVNTFDIPLLQKVGLESSRLQANVQLAEEAVAKKEKDADKRLADAQEAAGKYQLFSREFQITMFVLLFIGFAIKVPMFPFHTWLPDAHVEAPTPISMILAGVLLKMGGYGILRIAYPICPWAAYELAWVVGIFGIINIVYGALAAMAQTDFKKLVAYSSISHMGYVLLGISVWTSLDRFQYWAWGMNGAMFQMIAHGVSSAGMFFLVGVIYDRAHHRDLNKFGGLNNAMPLYSGLSAVIFFGAMGLPGLCGFVGEFFTILGTWNFAPAGHPLAGKLFAVLSALTVVLTAGYILWTIQRVFLGSNPKYDGYPDINAREILCIAPLLVLTVLLGVFPGLLLEWMEPSVTGLVKDLAGIFGS